MTNMNVTGAGNPTLSGATYTREPTLQQAPAPVRSPSETPDRYLAGGLSHAAPQLGRPSTNGGAADPRFSDQGNEIVINRDVQKSGATNVGGPDGTTSPENVRRALAYVDRHGRGVSADGKERPLSPEEVRKIAEPLSRFPPWVLDRMEKAGVDIRVREKWDNPNAFATYDGRSNQVNFRQDTLDTLNGDTKDYFYSAALHEFGHALDDVLKDDKNWPGIRFDDTNWNSDAREFRDIFSEYRTRANGGGDHVKYGGHLVAPNERELFAVGVENYLGNRASRERLRAVEPRLYEYLRNILGDFPS